jgi:hypothetical protein
MNRQARRAAAKSLAARQASEPETMTPVPPERWPSFQGSAVPVEVWLSRRFLAVVYRDGGFLRLSVNRAELGRNGWAAEITWDELQAVKREIGRGEQWAVEVYPADSGLVNVANMRHLWLLDGAPDYAWNSRPFTSIARRPALDHLERPGIADRRVEHGERA